MIRTIRAGVAIAAAATAIGLFAVPAQADEPLGTTSSAPADESYGDYDTNPINLGPCEGFGW